MKLPIFLIVLLAFNLALVSGNSWTVERPLSFGPNDLVADFLVVGSGAGGSAFARGVLDGGFSVFVFESGDNYNNLEEVWSPLETNVMYSTKSNKYGFQIRTEVGTATGAATYMNTGRLFGGSTSHNGMQYVRGSPGYFNRWAQYGGSEWSTANMLSAFKSLENYLNEQTHAPSPGRGNSGPVNVRRPANGPQTGVGSLANKIANWSSIASGIDLTPDYNGASQPYGHFARYDVFETPSRNRTSAATAFLGSGVLRSDGTGVLGKPIKVFFKTTVTRVLFNRLKTAVGIDAVSGGVPIRVWARKEVIVAANFQSVNLLQLSGIGPQDTLTSFGIPVIYNNPNVGLNFGNHPLAVLVFSFNATTYGDITTTQDPQALYAGGGFYPSVNEDGTFAAADPSQPRTFQTLWQSAGVPGLGVYLAQFVHPASTGKVTIQSNDPFHIPSVQEGFYSNPDDLEQFGRFLFHFVQNNMTDFISSQNPGFFGTWTRWNSVNDAKTWLTQNLNEGSHFTSTNRMALSAANGVVDFAGRVFGVKGLRVADTSVIPEISDGNTAALGMLIGKRFAEFAVAQNRGRK